MEAAHEKDRARKTKAGHPSKLRDALRAVCRSWLKEIAPNDPETHPVELGVLTFKIFTRYLEMFKKRVKNSRLCSETKGVTVMIRLGASAFDAVCSALSHLYHEGGLDKEVLSKDLWSRLLVYKKGGRRAGIFHCHVHTQV